MAFKNLITSLLFLLIISVSSCSYFKEKMKCDNKEANELLKANIKSDIIEAFALKLSADAYTEYKYGFFSAMSDSYKKYLLIELKKIKQKEGVFYEQALEQYSDNNVNLKNIITDSYDEKIDKCECSAEVELTNSESRNKVTFDNIKNSEGEVTGHYIYKPKSMLDENTNASDFIKTNKSLLDEIIIPENESHESNPKTSTNGNGEMNIRKFIAFEDDKNFEGISSTFSSKIVRYWKLNYPSLSQVEKVYADAWDLKTYSKNEIETIYEEEPGTYKVTLNYTFTNKNNIRKTVKSNVWFVVDNDGKIEQTYGEN